MTPPKLSQTKILHFQRKTKNKKSVVVWSRLFAETKYPNKNSMLSCINLQLLFLLFLLVRGFVLRALMWVDLRLLENMDAPKLGNIGQFYSHKCTSNVYTKAAILGIVSELNS